MKFKHQKKRFSKRYSTYAKWKKVGKRDSKYARRIKRLHRRYPTLSLAELRTATLSNILPLPKRKWNKLEFHQKYERNVSLVARRLMVRKGYSLDTASDETGLPEDTIKAHLGGVLYKRGGFWNAKHNDKIQRRMHIYSEGEIKEINVSNFLDASKLGKYFVNVQKALRTNDDAFLEKYRRKGIRDSSGKTHYFELDLEKLREIEEGKEDPEYWQVYVYE